MRRTAIAATWVWFALAQSAQPVSARAPAFDVGADGVARAALPAMCGDNVANVVLTARPSSPLFAAVAAVPVEDDSPVAWCLTPDDPRCAPRDASSLPDATRAAPPLHARERAVLADLFAEVMAIPRALQLGAARPGNHNRIDRPPRS